MKSNKWLVIVAIFMVACLVSIIGVTSAIGATPPTIKIRYFTVTAPLSPSNAASLQNAMSFIDKDGVLGLIPIDIGNDPAALNMPHMWRVCDAVFSTSPSFTMWDATNNPTGNFANQYGKRRGWGLDWRNITPFHASDIWFFVKSSDAANASGYSGNLATNTSDGSALIFSTTLRGELWDSSGQVIETYYSGESVSTHPVNRVMALIREGYTCSGDASLAIALTYFRNQIPITNTCGFYMLNGSGATNFVTSRPYCNPPYKGEDGKFSIYVEGQRQLGTGYYLNRSPLIRPTAWTTIATNHEGIFIDQASSVDVPASFYRAIEFSPFSKALTTKGEVEAPKLVISNGPE
jgi:hypothetical protein